MHFTLPAGCGIGRKTDAARLDRFNEAFRAIGIAFQIQDDVLNLVGETTLYGKEPLGDLLEGKRTIMMMHLFRTANAKLRVACRRSTRCLAPRRNSTRHWKCLKP